MRDPDHIIRYKQTKANKNTKYNSLSIRLSVSIDSYRTDSISEWNRFKLPVKVSFSNVSCVFGPVPP